MEAYMAERKELYLGSILAAWIGLIDLAYLTWIKLTDNVAACGGIGDCDVVNNSRYAQIGPIPIALLGMGAFLLILVLLYWEKRNPRSVEMSRYGVFLLALIGTLYSGYLTYVEVAILKAICPLCVLSALMLVVLLGLSAWRLNLYIQAT